MMRWIAMGVLGLMLGACGGGGGGGGGAGPPASGNQAPAFTSSATASVAENSGATVYTAVASDPNNDPIQYALSGDADRARFSINSANGQLSFVAPPDFELPGDGDRNNVYQVTITASDASSSATLNLSLSVINVSGRLATRRVGTGFSAPLFLTATGDQTGRLLVVQRGGVIRVLDPRNGQIEATPYLDIATTISQAGEGGLLGLALAPDFSASRNFYVNVTNAQNDTEIRRYRTLASNPDRADAASGDVILFIDQPNQFTNHRAGWIGFGQDNLLYVPMGDGGGGGDPLGNGQNRNTLLGKVLRIDPRTDAFPNDANRDYAIPPGNPFVTGGALAEIYAIGLRNPFRNSFDRATGNLYLGDVGQNAIEEISLLRPQDTSGLNFGWNILEGTQVFTAGQNTAGLTPPIIQYPHGAGAQPGPLEGRSVTGGYVYRGPVESLRGNYVFGDFISRRIWSVPVSSIAQGATLTNTSFTDRTSAFTPDVGAIGNIASFGEDDLGNLFIVDFDGEIFHITEIE
jgi:hypothetical protein